MVSVGVELLAREGAYSQVQGEQVLPTIARWSSTMKGCKPPKSKQILVRSTDRQFNATK